ncbi:MAG TPA: glycine cleavage system protein GcvH [Mycobacteriales bacterium]|jgi:glycine cleavage system H protein|nr:glycine cleavage system protein GcvH [Mycobacteriales bacterium]
MTSVPEELRYTADHEWLRWDGNVVRVGITDYAQQALGDIVFVSLPSLGSDVSTGDVLGEVESTKSVSDVYAPVAGRVSRRNEALDSAPELVNSDPYGAGWLAEVETPGAPTGEGLLDAAGYARLVDEAP